MTLLPDTPLFPTGQDHYKDWQGLSDGSLAAVLAEVARTADGPLLVAAPDSSRAQQLADALGFYLAGNPGAAGEVPVMLFPDWETLPYDLFSPHQDIVSDRIRVLNWLHGAGTGVLVVPVNTLMQRIAPPLHISGNSFMLRVGETFDMETTRARLVDCGYRQRDNVYEHGEFAVRGAIMDVFPMGSEQPFRVELFDEDIESLRLFDPESQRSTGQVSEINLLPAAEYPLSAEGIRRFRTAFRDTFDVDPRKVPLYQDVSEGIATPGLEYYLPLFFDGLATLFDYLPGKARAVEMAGCEEAARHFWDEVSARYEQRRHDIRRPVLPPTDLFLRPDQLNSAWQTLPRARQKDSDQAVRFDVEVPPTVSADAKARNPLAPLHTFADAHPDTRILVVAETAGRREALLEMMQKIGIQPVMKEGWAHFINEPDRWALTRGELDAGFYAPDHDLLVVTESELYGERVM